MRILFLTATRIGDAVLSTGALRTAELATRRAGDDRLRPGVVVVVRRRAGSGAADRRREAARSRCIGPVSGRMSRAAVGLVVDLARDPRSAVAGAGPVDRRDVRRDLHQVHGWRAPSASREPARRLIWTAPSTKPGGGGLIPAGRAVLALGPTANWAAKTWRGPKISSSWSRGSPARAACCPGVSVAVFGVPDERTRARRCCVRLPPARPIDLTSGGDLLTARPASRARRCSSATIPG